MKNQVQHRIDYYAYIRSPEWKAKHKPWLRQSGFRCAMFPWIVVGKQSEGRYCPYRIHHAHYRTLGDEKLWWDVLPLCPFAHNFIIHGILSGFKSVKDQKNYPNAAQRAVHFWCRIPAILKGLIVLSMVVAIASGWVWWSMQPAPSAIG